MTGSHEVRGSIPLGSTNHFYNLALQHDSITQVGELPGTLARRLI